MDRSDHDRLFSNDLATDLGLPVIVIAHNRPGCLDHILRRVRSIEAAGIACAGVILK
jgi:dethiobiotin synthetase